jgi:hypothetical protein
MKKHTYLIYFLTVFLSFIGNSQTTLWQNGFDTPSQWTQTYGPSHTSGNWQFLTSLPSNITSFQASYQWPATFSAAAGNFIFINSDAAGANASQDAYLEYNSNINLSTLGNSPFELTFNDYYRNYLDQTFVEVSNDGGATWSTFEVNPETEVPVNTNSIDGEIESILINPFAGAWSNQVRIRFHYLGNYDWFWGVDNVKIKTLPNYNLVLNNLSWGSTGAFGARIPYYQIPVSQIVPIEFAGSVTNFGLQDQNDVILTVNSTGFIGNSIGTTLNSGVTDNLLCQTFTPPGIGTYTIQNASVSSPNTDAIPADNTITNIATIEVTDFVYARDNGVINANFSGYSANLPNAEVGNVFDIFSNVIIDAIDVTPASGVGEGISVKLYFYDINIGSWVFMDESLPYVIDPSDIGTTVTIPLLTPQNLSAGQSYLAVAAFSSQNVDVAYSSQNEEFTSWLYDASTWYFLSATPLIRMRFSSCTANINYQTINNTACQSYTSSSGQVYTQSGSYQEITQNVNGCDSIVTTLNLNINTFDNLNSQVQITPTYCSSPTGSAAVTLTSDTPAVGTTFYISEYFSGNANNKSIEIYNPTNQPIDLGASFPSPTGNSPSSSLLLSNSAGQLFSFPANTILPAFGTILVSSNNSTIPSDFYSSIIDGSDMALGLYESITIFGNVLDFFSPLDVASTTLSTTSIRNNSVTSYNGAFTPSEWTNQAFPTTIIYPFSLGSHYDVSPTDFTIQWSNGTTNNSLTNLSEGMYSYNVVKTSTGCVVYTEDVIVPTTGNNFNPAFSSTQQLFTSPPFAVQFSNTTANPSNYSFVWNWGDGSTTASNNASVFHEYLYNGQYTVSLIATNIVTGCSDTTTITDYIFCTGGVTCTHTASISQQGPIQACAGTDVWLSCNNDPSFSYQWRRNGINVPGNDNDSLLVTQSGNYTVTIYVNNCPVTSNGISVTINPLPSIPTITSTGTITSCFGGSLTLAAPAGLASYSWNTGATTASISVTQSGNYTVTVTNASGCARTSAPYVVNASFMSSPNVCVVGMDSLTNENRIVWEKPLTSGIDSFYVYKETNVSDVYTKIGATDYPDLAVFLDQNSNPAVQAYRYKLTVLDTCGTETLLSDFHKTIHLTINAGVGGAWNLIWSHYEGLAFGSYNIYRGTDPTNISLLTTIQSNLNSYTDLAPPVGPVYYQIEIVNPSSCDPAKVINYSISRSNIVNNGVNGINALSNSTVLVYPNPTSKDVTLEITSELLGKDYYLTDYTGRIISKGQFRALKETMTMEQVATGVYFIKIDNNANLMYKIVKN